MWLRARSEQKKEIRNKELIKVCIKLYNQENFDDITISKITKEAGWTRSNFYKYYKSKEEVFLDVIIYLFDDWLKTVEKNLSKETNMTAYSFSKLWLNSYEKNNCFTKLISLSSSLIEDHCSLKKVIDFKKSHLDKMGVVAQLLKDKTNAEDKNIEKFIIIQSSIIQGGYHFFQVSDLKKTVLKNLESTFEHEFNNDEVKEYIIEALEMISEKLIFK